MYKHFALFLISLSFLQASAPLKFDDTKQIWLVEPGFRKGAVCENDSHAEIMQSVINKALKEKGIPNGDAHVIHSHGPYEKQLKAALNSSAPVVNCSWSCNSVFNHEQEFDSSGHHLICSSAGNNRDEQNPYQIYRDFMLYAHLPTEEVPVLFVGAWNVEEAEPWEYSARLFDDLKILNNPLRYQFIWAPTLEGGGTSSASAYMSAQMLMLTQEFPLISPKDLINTAIANADYCKAPLDLCTLKSRHHLDVYQQHPVFNFERTHAALKKGEIADPETFSKKHPEYFPSYKDYVDLQKDPYGPARHLLQAVKGMMDETNPFCDMSGLDFKSIGFMFGLSCGDELLRGDMNPLDFMKPWIENNSSLPSCLNNEGMAYYHHRAFDMFAQANFAEYVRTPEDAKVLMKLMKERLEASDYENPVNREKLGDIFAYRLIEVMEFADTISYLGALKSHLEATHLFGSVNINRRLSLMSGGHLDATLEATSALDLKTVTETLDRYLEQSLALFKLLHLLSKAPQGIYYKLPYQEKETDIASHSALMLSTLRQEVQMHRKENEMPAAYKEEVYEIIGHPLTP